MSKESDDKIDEDEANVVLKGFVLSWSIPSRAYLQDWLRLETEEEVRVREVVELFPEDIFRELAAIRRNFYKVAEGLVLPAYGIKLLPTEGLPKLKELIAKTSKRLQELDTRIEEALKSDYHEKAVDYYTETAEASPKKVSKISGRFGVSMIPLRIDAFTWDTFLTDEMKRQLDSIDYEYKRRREINEQSMAEMRDERRLIEAKLKDAETMIENAESEVAKAYEPMTLPVDVTTMRVQKKELEAKIKEMKKQETKLQRKINRLQTDQVNDRQSFQRSARWARDMTEETRKQVSFDVKRLWTQNLQDLVKRAIDTFDLSKKRQIKSLKYVKTSAEETQRRIWSLQPDSNLVKKYEKFLGLVVRAINGEPVKEEFEVFS